MSTPIDDGAPAFPVPDVVNPDGQIQFGSNGMSLRDYFAAKAMQAEIITTFSDATPKSVKAFVEAARAAGRTAEAHLAFNSYEIADAMILARKSLDR